MTHRIGQILWGMVHHVFEWDDTDPTWPTAQDMHGNPIPEWPPTQDGPVVLVNITNLGINEGDGWNPDTNSPIPRPCVGWNEETFEFDIATAPESNVAGIKS